MLDQKKVFEFYSWQKIYLILYIDNVSVVTSMMMYRDHDKG